MRRAAHATGTPRQGVEGDLERELRDELAVRLVRAGLCVRGLDLAQFELSRELAAAIQQKKALMVDTTKKHGLEAAHLRLMAQPDS